MFQQLLSKDGLLRAQLQENRQVDCDPDVQQECRHPSQRVDRRKQLSGHANQYARYNHIRSGQQICPPKEDQEGRWRARYGVEIARPEERRFKVFWSAFCKPAASSCGLHPRFSRVRSVPLSPKSWT